MTNVLQTHQLKLSPPVISRLDAAVKPQGADRWQIVQEDFGLYYSLGHHGRASVEGHHDLSMALVGRVSPRDVQLLPSIHKHPHS